MPTDHLMQDSPATKSPAADWPCLPQAALNRPTLPRFMFIVGTGGVRRLTAAQGLKRRQRIEQAASGLDGRVEQMDSPFGDGMSYTICELPSNRAAASFATVMRAAYATGVRTVALPKPRRSDIYLTS